MTARQTPIPVMVTGVGGGGHGRQIVKALRLAETPYEIVGTDMSECSSGLYAVDRPYLLPPAGHHEYLPALLAACRKHGVRALFHGSEPELKVFSANRAALVSAGLFLPINPADVIDTCMDKVRTAQRLTALGFRVPPFRRVRSTDEAAAFDALPAVLKPSVGGGGKREIPRHSDVRNANLEICDTDRPWNPVVGEFHDLDAAASGHRGRVEDDRDAPRCGGLEAEIRIILGHGDRSD